MWKDDREKKKCVGGRRGEAGLVIKVFSDMARQQRLLGDPGHINHPSVCQPPSIIAASPALSSCWSSLDSCLFPSSLFLLAFLKVRAFSNYTAKKKKWCRALFTCGKLIAVLFSPVAAKGVNTKRQPDTQHVFILTLTWKLLQEKYCFTTAKPMQIYSMINTLFWSTSEFQGSWIKPDQSGSIHSKGATQQTHSDKKLIKPRCKVYTSFTAPISTPKYISKGSRKGWCFNDHDILHLFNWTYPGNIFYLSLALIREENGIPDIAFHFCFTGGVLGLREAKWYIITQGSSRSSTGCGKTIKGRCQEASPEPAVCCRCEGAAAVLTQALWPDLGWITALLVDDWISSFCPSLQIHGLRVGALTDWWMLSFMFERYFLFATTVQYTSPHSRYRQIHIFNHSQV